jgi:hypothetical protein
MTSIINKFHGEVPFRENHSANRSNSQMHLRLLRLFLFCSALTWGVSVYGVFAPWSAAVEALQGLGAKEVPDDPMLDYWLRMAAGAFTLIGIWYFILFLQPRRHAAIIPYFGWLMIVEGAILLIHGLRLQLPPFPFCADTAACFIFGAAIVYFSGVIARSDVTK